MTKHAMQTPRPRSMKPCRRQARLVGGPPFAAAFVAVDVEHRHAGHRAGRNPDQLTRMPRPQRREACLAQRRILEASRARRPLVREAGETWIPERGRSAQRLALSVVHRSTCSLEPIG